MEKPHLIIPAADPVEDETPKITPRQPLNCTKCRHFDPQENRKPDGNCLRYPPIVAFIGMQPHALSNQMVPVTNQFVPQVGPLFVCGEFSPKQEDLQ